MVGVIERTHCILYHLGSTTPTDSSVGVSVGGVVVSASAITGTGAGGCGCVIWVVAGISSSRPTLISTNQ